MATIIVSFDSEQEAQEAVERLTQANMGEVRARVMDSSEPLSHEKGDTTAPMITPDMGSVEVRPTEYPIMPESTREDAEDESSATIPTTGANEEQPVRGVQVMIEVDEEQEEQVRRILGMRGG